MSASGPSRAADLAAQQVERIVQAAETAAEQIKEGARAEGLREAEHDVAEARRQALALGQEARREAQAHVEQARAESERIRQQTQEAVEGRVAAAEKSAAEVLEEAQALHDGLRRLGEVLGDQAQRILGDVQAAHKRMQADLRVKPVEAARAEAPARRAAEPPAGAATLSEGERIIAAAEAARSEPRRRRGPGDERGRGNPFDDLEVPRWVERER